MKHTNIAKTKGRRTFQDIIISISYRKRQKVIRIQIKTNERKRAEVVINNILTGRKNIKKI